MKKAIVYIMSFFLIAPVYSQYRVEGGEGEPLREVNDMSNFIEVWLLNGLSGAEISFTSAEPVASHRWFKYKTSTGETFPVATAESSLTTSVIRDIEDGFGYYVGNEYGPGGNNVVWIIDYSQHLPQIVSVTFDEIEEERCENLKLIMDMDADPLVYYLTDGVYQEIRRHFFLEYQQLRWEGESKQFIQELKTEEFNRVVLEHVVDAPLVNTSYTLRGDQFAEHFGKLYSVNSPEYNAVAIDVHTYAYVIPEEGEEEELNSEQAYQAPLNVRFEAYSNDPPGVMYTWKIFKIDPSTGKRESSETYRYNTQNCEVNFTFSGTYDVVIEVKVPNSDETCAYETASDTQEFRLILEESFLRLPNAFSPGSSIGSNDVYKVYSKSLISFKASVFNRWGNILYTWTDPEEGWDGRVNGKYVPTGVYFVVVEAKGADGRNYKESSDINVLRSRN
ncbi:MAG: gliding motility-associated C-terminal domain-containing protein [Bacteroidales bacterium]|nr:gliding motility-associated C-terminal domain-containing protein [Bacteroidales bacterium]